MARCIDCMDLPPSVVGELGSENRPGLSCSSSSPGNGEARFSVGC